MNQCQNCAHQNPGDINFCEACENQVVCLACRALLRKGKSKCLVCGTVLGARPENSISGMNSLVLDESQTPDGYSRNIRVSMSDLAMEKASALLSGQSPFRIGRLTGRPEVRAAAPPLLSTPTTNGSFPEIHAAVAGTSDPEGDSIVPAVDEALGELFVVSESGRLESKVTDFNGKSKKEEQERFVILYAAAHELITGSAISSRETLSDAAKQAGLVANNDKHFGRYLSALVSRAFSSTGDGALRLNAVTMNNRLPAIIKDMFSGSKEKPGSKKPAQKNAGKKRPAQTKELPRDVASWIAKDISSIDAFDVRSLSTKLDQSLFAIWVITKVIGDTAAVKPAHAWLFLAERFKTISVSQKSFSDALSGGKKFAARNASDEYFLTPEGEAHIKEIVRKSPS